MLRAVQVFLTTLLSSPAAARLSPAFAVKFAQLKTLNAQITALAAVQEAPLEGMIEDRQKAYVETLEVTFGVAASVLSYALTHEQHAVVAQVSFSRTAFYRMRVAERMRLAQRVHDAAQTVLADLEAYGVTAANLVDLQQRIHATERAVDAPVEACAAKKVATTELVRLFAEAERLLAQLDPLLFPLKASDPTSYSRYWAARQVFDRRGGTSPVTDEADAADNPALDGKPTTQPLAA